VERWAGRADRSIFHIVGRRDWEAAAPSAPSSPPSATAGEAGLALIQVPYQERMEVVYAAADVVVCRAGAMTVAELAAAGVPSILVPLPGAPGDHQTANARVLARAGAAVVLADADCDAERLDAALDCLLAHPEGLDAMGRAAASLGHRDAAAAGAEVVEAHARPAHRGRG
jgi:UDP-N-acetylglucosamine--N-acetylmuramyl-(pentapeptide) pyrophosphoryl-undecaprenol N-acetylglucosamine transferase